METLKNCKVFNKRLTVNGNPLYDIKCEYNGQMITIKGVETYELNNDMYYSELCAGAVYQTAKRKTWKVNYITTKKGV